MRKDVIVTGGGVGGGVGGGGGGITGPSSGTEKHRGRNFRVPEHLLGDGEEAEDDAGDAMAT